MNDVAKNLLVEHGFEVNDKNLKKLYKEVKSLVKDDFEDIVEEVVLYFKNSKEIRNE